MKYGKTRRKQILATATVAVAILLAVIWIIYSKRPVYRVTQINPDTISTNNYRKFEIFSRNLNTPGYIEFHTTSISTQKWNAKYQSGGIPRDPYREKDIGIFIYDYLNHQYLSVEGPLVQYNPGNGSVIFAKDSQSYEEERRFFVKRVNNILSWAKVLTWRIPLPGYRSRRAPLYLGLPSAKTQIPEVVYSSERGGSLRSTSPDGRNILIPYITQDTKGMQRAWIINTESGSVIDISQLPGARGRHKTLPLSGSNFWVSDNHLIFETGHDSKNFPDRSWYRGDIYLVDILKNSCRLVIDEEAAYSYMALHDLTPAEFRVCQPRIIDGNIWVSLMAQSSQQEDFGRIDINLDTLESLHFNPGDHGFIAREIDRSDRIIIYEISKRDKSIMWLNYRTTGFVVLDKSTMNILTSFELNNRTGVVYPPEITGDKLLVVSRTSIWWCDSDGTNPEPIAPIDASPSLWQSISKPLDEAMLSKIKSLL